MPSSSTALQQVKSAWGKSTRGKKRLIDFDFKLTYESVLDVIAVSFDEFSSVDSLINSRRHFNVIRDKLLALDLSLRDKMNSFVEEGRQKTNIDVPFLNKVRRMHVLKGIVEDVIKQLSEADKLTWRRFLYVIGDLDLCFKVIWGAEMFRTNPFHCILITYMDPWVKKDENDIVTYPGLPKIMWF